ncbi:hypothetical protein IKG16_00295 [Candidatus Saccharibacteria bacterium]|nr:hypothetical protein [Candidatus Saccharibacteria bacterium]
MNASTVISKIYQKYAPKMAKIGVHLDIDIPDPTVKIAKPSQITKITEAYLDYCEKHPEKANITLVINRGKYYIKDDTRLVKTDERAMFETLALTSHIEVNIRARLGFGTTISVPLE